jgi:hypothetical protein
VAKLAALFRFFELEQIVERSACVAGVTGRGRRMRRRGAVAGWRSVPSHGNARLEQLAFVSLVLQCNAHGNRLQTLETSRGLKVGALLAAMYRCSALRAIAFPVHIARQGRRTIETSGSNYVLKQPGKAWPCDVNRRAGAVGLGAIFSARTSGITLGILVPALSILTVIVHLLFRLLKSALLHYADASIRRSKHKRNPC